MTEDNVRREIKEIFGQLEISVNGCSEDVIDHSINVGRHFLELTPRDLDKLFNLTGKYYRECQCGKKIKI